MHMVKILYRILESILRIVQILQMGGNTYILKRKWARFETNKLYSCRRVLGKWMLDIHEG